MTKTLPVFVHQITRSIPTNAFTANALAGNREITLKAGFDERDMRPYGFKHPTG